MIMNEWTKEHPKVSGYYWVRRRNMLTQLVYLTPAMLVFEFCNRNPLSSYYDIEEWGRQLNSPDEEPNDVA